MANEPFRQRDEKRQPTMVAISSADPDRGYDNIARAQPELARPQESRGWPFDDPTPAAAPPQSIERRPEAPVRSEPMRPSDGLRASDATRPTEAVRPSEDADSAPGAHPEYYSAVRIVTPEDPRRLDVTRAPGSQSPPAEYRDLLRQIQDVARLVVAVFAQDIERRKEFMGLLHMTAEFGLRGPNCSVEVGLDNLAETKHSIAASFADIREALWKQNLLILGALFLVCLPAGALIYYGALPGQMFAASSGVLSIPATFLLAAFWIPLGAAFGLFLEFVFRVGDDVSYEQLRLMNPGRWKPVQRAFNTVLVAYALAIVLAIGALQVGVANVLLNDFTGSKPYLVLVIGFITGIAYPYIRDLAQQFRPLRRDPAS